MKRSIRTLALVLAGSSLSLAAQAGLQIDSLYISAGALVTGPDGQTHGTTWFWDSTRNAVAEGLEGRAIGRGVEQVPTIGCPDRAEGVAILASDKLGRTPPQSLDPDPRARGIVGSLQRQGNRRSLTSAEPSRPKRLPCGSPRRHDGLLPPECRTTVGTQASQAPRCTRLLTSSQSRKLSSGAIAALIIAGVGGAVGVIIAAASADNVTPTSIVVSGFRP